MPETPVAYPCPCCGYHTFGAEPPGSYIVCPVCCWEDLPPYADWTSSYGGALPRAQRTYLAIGASHERYRAIVRPPEPHEQRSDDWQPIDTLIETLGQAISDAFADVTRGDGITLHEADCLDSYGTDEELAAARRVDTDRHWSEVPDDVIEGLPSAFSFLDARGFHYYLPAYMWWTLRCYTQSASTSLDAALYALALQPWDTIERFDEAAKLARYQMLTPEQAHVVCRFLRFVVAFGEGCLNVALARKALAQYWDRFCGAPATK